MELVIDMKSNSTNEIYAISYIRPATNEDNETKLDNASVQDAINSVKVEESITAEECFDCSRDMGTEVASIGSDISVDVSQVFNSSKIRKDQVSSVGVQQEIRSILIIFPHRIL